MLDVQTSVERHVDSFLTLKRNAEAYIELSNEGYLHIVIVDVLVSVIVSVSVYSFKPCLIIASSLA